METLDEHRVKLKEITDYAFGHGFKAIGIEPFKKGPPNNWDKEIRNKFLIACHDGFKAAQKLLIIEIKKYQSLLRTENELLKESRRLRDKEKQNENERNVKIIEQRLLTFSHIADGIAWQIIGGQIHIARRFHIRQDANKFLDSSNLEHTIEIADSINKNPNDFALISDLTGFIQIGDLLIKKDGKVGIMELKEGKVNDSIRDFFEAMEHKGEIFNEDTLVKQFDDITVKQIKRMQRQKERAIRATDVINNDKGIDPVSGENIIINSSTVVTEYYFPELMQLQEDLQNKNWAYTVIDKCLHIGMYKDKGIMMAEFTIKAILQQQTENYILIDWLSIKENLSQPVFAKPFSPDFIIDVLTGKIKIIIGLNVDILIELFNYLGLKTRWLTPKETARKQQKATIKGMVIVKKRGIAITYPDGQEAILYGGILSKILYDSIRPSNIALSILSISK